MVQQILKTIYPSLMILASGNWEERISLETKYRRTPMRTITTDRGINTQSLMAVSNTKSSAMIVLSIQTPATATPSPLICLSFFSWHRDLERNRRCCMYRFNGPLPFSFLFQSNLTGRVSLPHLTCITCYNQTLGSPILSRVFLHLLPMLLRRNLSSSSPVLLLL